MEIEGRGARGNMHFFQQFVYSSYNCIKLTLVNNKKWYCTNQKIHVYGLYETHINIMKHVDDGGPSRFVQDETEE